MNDSIKKHMDGQTPVETDKAEAVRDEALRDEELDAVAGGEGYNDGKGYYRPGWPSCGGVGSAGTEYIECPDCGGPILRDPRYKHDCPAKQVPIRP